MIERLNNYKNFIQKRIEFHHTKQKSTKNAYEQLNEININNSLLSIIRNFEKRYITVVMSLKAGESAMLNFGEFYEETKTIIDLYINYESKELDPYKKWGYQELIRELKFILAQYEQEFL